jgi:hypothetical protein
MVNLPWLEDLNYQSPQYGGGGSNDLLSLIMGMQPTGPQSFASALPFYNLPKKQAKFYQPAYDAANAMADTDNPLYKKIYGQQRQRGQDNLAQSIAELTRQNRKQAGMGRTELFDPERGGETLFRGVTQGYQDVQNQANDDTLGILSKNADNLYKQAGVQSQLAANKAGIKGNLLGSLTKLFGL